MVRQAVSPSAPSASSPGNSLRPPSTMSTSGRWRTATLKQTRADLQLRKYKEYATSTIRSPLRALPLMVRGLATTPQRLTSD